MLDPTRLIAIVLLVASGCTRDESEPNAAHDEPPLGWCDARPVPNVLDAVSVTIWRNETCVVTRFGSVTCWGEGDWPTATDAPQPDFRPTRLRSLGDDVVDIVVSMNRSCSLHADGEVRCWGPNSSPKKLPVPPARQVVLDGTTTWVLTRDGKVFDSSAVEITFPEQPVHRLLAAEAEFGDEFALAVIAGDARRIVVDLPAEALFGLSTPLTGVEDALFIDGFWQGCVIEERRGLGCWVADTWIPYLNVAPLRFEADSASTREIAMLGRDLCRLGVDGGVRCTHKNGYHHPELDDVKAIAGGPCHACVVKGDGRVWCWGLADRGRLGREPCTSDQ